MKRLDLTESAACIFIFFFSFFFFFFFLYILCVQEIQMPVKLAASCRLNRQIATGNKLHGHEIKLVLFRTDSPFSSQPMSCSDRLRKAIVSDPDHSQKDKYSRLSLSRS